jgi:hypothetical protein
MFCSCVAAAAAFSVYHCLKPPPPQRSSSCLIYLIFVSRPPHFSWSKSYVSALPPLFLSLSLSLSVSLSVSLSLPLSFLSLGGGDGGGGGRTGVLIGCHRPTVTWGGDATVKVLPDTAYISKPSALCNAIYPVYAMNIAIRGFISCAWLHQLCLGETGNPGVNCTWCMHLILHLWTDGRTEINAAD